MQIKLTQSELGETYFSKITYSKISPSYSFNAAGALEVINEFVHIQ